MDQVRIMAEVVGDYGLWYCRSSKIYKCDVLLMIQTASLIGYTFKKELMGSDFSVQEWELFCSEGVKNKDTFFVYGQSGDSRVTFRVDFAKNSKNNNLLVTLSSILKEEHEGFDCVRPLDIADYLPSLLLLIEEFEIISLIGQISSRNYEP